MRTRALREMRTSAGFTLLELAMALFVLSVIALIFASTVPSAAKMSHMNGQYAQASSLCQHKIDQMRAVGFGRLTYAELSDAGIIDRYPSIPPYSFAQVDAVGNYLPEPSTRITVEQVPGQSQALKVTASVSWKTARHQSHTSGLTVTALIANLVSN